jgi:hypothetical protein
MGYYVENGFFAFYGKIFFATKPLRHKGIFKQKSFFVPLSLCGNFPVYPD